MNKLIFVLLLLLPFLAHSQIPIKGLAQFRVGGISVGTGGGTPTDSTYELRADTGIVNIPYNSLMPNIQETTIGILSFFMDYVPDGFSGNVRFIYNIAPVVNGILTTPFPSGPAIVTKTFTKATGVPLTWN